MEFVWPETVLILSAYLLAKISSAPKWLIQSFHRFHLRRFTSRRPEWQAGLELN
jgi:hypothetical protein